MDKKLEIEEVIKTIDVDGDFDSSYRIEILKTTNSAAPFSSKCYERVEDIEMSTGHWSQLMDFPWLSAKTQDDAVDESLSWLQERLK